MSLTGDLSWRARRLVQRVGVDVVPYSRSRHPVARRLALFEQHGIDLVLDVGANTGQYGGFLRRIGYQGRILSFEPLGSAFDALERQCTLDPLWEGRHLALGRDAGRTTLHVSANSECSSVLPILDRHLEVYPEGRFVGTEEVEVSTVEAVMAALPASETKGIFLKIDTQGYERPVLEGIGSAWDRIAGVQLEMSLVPLYDGESLMPELVTLMGDRGFVLMGIEPGSSDGRTGQLLQIDGLFFRA